MTIKKVRILDIHPSDPRYEDKQDIVGKIFILDIEDVEYEEGWAASIVNLYLADFSYETPLWDVSYHEMYAFKYEEVEE